MKKWLLVIRAPFLLLAVVLGFLGGYLTHCYDRWAFRWRKTPLSIVCFQIGAISIATAPGPGYLLLTGLAAALLLLALNRLITGQRILAGGPERVTGA